MSWIEKIRNKSHAEKVRLIWIISIVVIVILVLVWILTSRIGEDLPKDTSLFNTIKNGVSNLTK